MMKKDAGKKMRGPTLQELEMIPIDDPAVLEIINRRLKLAKKGEGDELLVMPPWDLVERAEFDRLCKEYREARFHEDRAEKRKFRKRK